MDEKMQQIATVNQRCIDNVRSQTHTVDEQQLMFICLHFCTDRLNHMTDYEYHDRRYRAKPTAKTEKRAVLLSSATAY